MGFIQPALTIRPTHTRSSSTCGRTVIRAHTAPVARLPQPVGDRIVVRRDSDEKTSSGGLVLTGETEKCHTGEVVAAGSGRYSPAGRVEAMPVQVGDRVFWKDEYGAEEVPGEKDLLILRAFSVTATF